MQSKYLRRKGRCSQRHSKEFPHGRFAVTLVETTASGKSLLLWILETFDQNSEPKSEFSWELQFERVCAQQPCTIFLFIGKLFNQKTQYHPVDEKAFPNKLHSWQEKMNVLKNGQI